MLPNLLTVSRLLLTPFVIRAILAGQRPTALFLFAVAAATDFLDGAAARHFHTTSTTGAYLDPIADKCLLSGVYLAFGISGIVPWWFVILIFGRDIYILLAVGAFMLFTRVRRFPPSVWGKISTFVQIVTATLVLIGGPASILLWSCAGATLWSGIHYTWRGIRMALAKET
jgi:cardiolipin synthase